MPLSDEPLQTWESRTLKERFLCAGIYAGSEAGQLLTKEIADSVGLETFPFKAVEEFFSTAVGDVSNRLIAVLDGKPDPGPPVVSASAEHQKRPPT